MTTADNQPLGQALAENQAFLQTMFGGSSDFYTKSFTICGCRCCIAMFAGLSSPEKLCIMVLHALGYESINAACICGAEVVNPKIQSTVDADALAHMTERWSKYNMNVCGPVALDLAVSKEACHHKHYTAPGAGDADILLVPNYEVGNGIGKAANLFGNAKNAGIILGAKVPIVLVSRADSAYSKLASIALGSVLSSRMKLA